MSGTDPTLGLEVDRALRAILASLAPAIQAAADYLARTTSAPGKCQQTWCVLCALTALAEGEQHPLPTLVAEHGASLLGLIEAMVNSKTPDDPAGDVNHPSPSSYQPIAVTIVE